MIISEQSSFIIKEHGKTKILFRSMSTHQIPCQTFGQLRQTPGKSLSLDWWLVSLLDQSVDPTNQFQTI